jgi:hypothetical protein
MSDISVESSPKEKIREADTHESEERWLCSSCTFSNVLELRNCEMCDAPINLTHKKVKLDKKPEIVV